MLAHDFYHQGAMRVSCVPQVEDGFLVRIESDVQVAVLGLVQRKDAAFYRGAHLDHFQATGSINMLPHNLVALFSR